VTLPNGFTLGQANKSGSAGVEGGEEGKEMRNLEIED
jgi:hypothetical protein